MAASVFSFVPEATISDVLGNLQSFTGLAIQLIDSSGTLLLSFGQPTSYCTVLQKNVFDKSECFSLHMKAGQRAQTLGEAYIFSCHANLNHIAFPLVNRGELLAASSSARFSWMCRTARWSAIWRNENIWPRPCLLSCTTS